MLLNTAQSGETGSIQDKAPLSITKDFPGGNIHLGSVQGNTVHLRPELRDTTTDWFYWYFAVRGAGSRTLTFILEPKYVGVRGPGVSTDGGGTWQWLGAESSSAGTFSYAFAEDIPEVRFSVAMPYVRSDWESFLQALPLGAESRTESLAQTARGRDVPLLLMGKQNAPLCVAITGRQHACEMMASYVIEGIVEGVFAGDAAGKWLRENVGFFIVPLVDADGVEQGDQGKNRVPHDHNRDYQGMSVYEEVRALKERLPVWSAGRPLISFDLHCPALCGPVHESVFFIEPGDRIQAGRVDRLSECLGRVEGESGIARHPNKLAFGAGFNTTPASDKRNFSSWSSALPNSFLAVSLEIAYANASGSEVNAGSARELGRHFAIALRDWLTDEQSLIPFLNPPGDSSSS